MRGSTYGDDKRITPFHIPIDERHRQVAMMTDTTKHPYDSAIRGSQSLGAPAPHPRTIGWFGTTALAMGGSNQSLFLIGTAAGLIAIQGSAAIPLLILGLLL